MKKIHLILLLFSFLISQAQKSSPVMGDAATLIDLLKKDYNMVNPDNRDEEINTDRGKVIGIFKSYLEEEKKKELNLLPNPFDYKNSFNTYLKSKETLNLVSKMSISTQTEVAFENVKNKISDLQDSLLKHKKDFYDLKFKYDLSEIDLLIQNYIENSYLHYTLNQFKNKYNNLQINGVDLFAEKNANSSIQKSIPFIGGDLAFETIIDGLSRFLAKRIKEELTINAIDKIKTYLENPTPENYCNELLVILPTTTNYIKTFHADQLLNFTDELKQYIEQDLNNLLINSVHLKNTPRFKNYINDNPDLDFAFEGLEIITQLSKIKSPVDYFEVIENSRTLNSWRNNLSNNSTKYNISQSLRLATMLAFSMTVIDNGEIKFASIDFLSNYGKEKNFYFLYFGMLHQQNKKYFNVNFLKTDNISYFPLEINKLMNNANPYILDDIQENMIKSNFDFLKSNLVPIIKYAEKIQSQALLIKKKNKNNEEIKYQEIYSFIDDIIAFAENTVETSELLLNQNNFIVSDNTIKIKEKLAPYFEVAKISNNIVLDLHEKKYSNAIIRAIEIPLSFKILPKNHALSIKNIKTAIENQADLKKMNDIFSINLVNTKDIIADDIIAKKRDLKLLELKFNDSKHIRKFKKSIEILNSNLVAITPDKNLIVENYKKTIDILENDYKLILNYYGINTTLITNHLQNALNSNFQNNKVTNYLEIIIDSFTKNMFLNTILGKPIDIGLETEINNFLVEFSSQSKQSSAKINDNKAIKLIHLINDISTATDAVEVEKAIESFALPVGSSTLKEKASTYVSINAFPGILLGLEHSDLESNKNSFALGFTAPVGFYLQFCNNNKSGVWGTFIPIIDIAAPVRLRLDDNANTQNLPDFNFKDIFSPGIYFTYGFPKSPFALNFGIQSGPRLRNITEDGGASFKDVNSYRVGVGFVIDIPLLTLSSKYND